MAANDNALVTNNSVTAPVSADPIDIQNFIYMFRGQQVMLDSDLAMLYQVETKYLNRAVKRNIDRFPEDFCFQLSAEEFENLKCQIGTSSLDEGKTLNLLSKKQPNVTVEIYTSRTGNALTRSDISTFNRQYSSLQVKYTNNFHDRFLILDHTTGYHIGASIKDAGKKCFAISLIEDTQSVQNIIARL